MNAAQGNHWLNSLTRVCLCATASVTPTWVVLETVIFLQNVCGTTHGISTVGSPVCQLAGGHLEMTLVAWVPCTLAEMEITMCKMCKDQVRKKSSMLAFRNGSMPIDTPSQGPGVCPNFLCRNCCTANKRPICVIVLIADTCWTASHIQSLFLSLL